MLLSRARAGPLIRGTKLRAGTHQARSVVQQLL